MHKLTVDPTYSFARLSSSKIKLWDLLCFQGVVQYDWELQKPSFQWRQAVTARFVCVFQWTCEYIELMHAWLQGDVQMEPQPWQAGPQREGTVLVSCPHF